MNPPIPFSVRISPRAKWASLRMSLEAGLVVVIPRHYDVKKVTALIESKRPWIEKHHERLEKFRATAPQEANPLPSEIIFLATSERWPVRYVESSRSGVRISEKNNELVLIGHVASQLACRRALRRWLLQKAKASLIPWLRNVSEETNIRFATVAVRLQRSRWGSCSRRGTISINAKLLFLAPELVRYLFIHELCHLLQMNHSAKYWNCVREKEPDYKNLDRRMRNAMRAVPRWAV